MAGGLGNESSHQSARIARIGVRRQQPGLVRQILQLQEQLCRIVSIFAERERFRKDRNESLSLFSFEAHFACMKRIGEAKDRPEPFDSKLETIESARRACAHYSTRSREFSPDS